MQAHPGVAMPAPQTPPPPQYQQAHPHQQIDAHSRTIASVLPPEPMPRPQAAAQPMAIPMAPMAGAPPAAAGQGGASNPTHVSAHKPAGAPMYPGAQGPVVEIVQAPPFAAPMQGAAWWIVGVVGVVAFGLGLTLGLLLG
jgi:hypothetical protein